MVQIAPLYKTQITQATDYAPGNASLGQRFHVVGAFDRFNYGDLLFPHLTAHFLRRQYGVDTDIRFYGIRTANLEPEGGVKTQTLRQMFRSGVGHNGQLGKDDVVWIAGGEVLSSSWALMVEHILPHGISGLVRRMHRRIGHPRASQIYRRLFRVPNRMPWLFAPKSGRDAALSYSVVYNSVGGQAVGKHSSAISDWQRQCLQEASWLALRDSKSQTAVRNLGVPQAHLSPDSAVMMTELRSPAELAKLRANVLLRMGLNPAQRYIALQCGLKYLPGQDLGPLTGQIDQMQAQQHMPVIGFAIGRAAGHDDQISARNIEAACTARGINFLRAPDDLTVWEIMAFIAGSACYVGTSLHGFITAFAFGRPRVGLSQVGKLIGFRDDWDLPETPAGIAPQALAAAVDSALRQNPAALTLQADRVRQRYLDDLHSLWNSLAARTA